MGFVNSSVEYVPQMPGLIGMYKHIEKAMRNCYRSEDKIDDTSYERMLKIAEDKHHYSPLAHGAVYLTIPVTDIETSNLVEKYKKNKYSTVNSDTTSIHTSYITTNFRVIWENNWFEDLKFLTEPTRFHEKMYTFKVECSIGVSREWNRHSTLAISEQSTRYCNLAKPKFNGEVTYIIPFWIYDIRDQKIKELGLNSELKGIDMLEDLSKYSYPVFEYLRTMETINDTYMNMINRGLKPQDARSILPLDTYTCVYYTGTKSAWEHFIELRSTQAAHPDIRILSDQVKDILSEIS